MSHRYGSRLVPASIPYHVFQALTTNLDGKDFLLQMYQLDENYLDKKYFLRPIEIENEERLQSLLRTSAESCYQQGMITKDERNEFFISGKSIRLISSIDYILIYSHSKRNLSCIRK